MTMYIQATGNISPQKTCGHPPLLTAPVEYIDTRLTCIEPEYKDIIDVKLIRRMSRIIKMGVASAMECLKEAGVTMPDAIVTGTAYGCLEDTGQFITKMVEHHEELLTPTSFIQSTHNTIGAQIGLMLQCNNYNNAFVHRGFSFESALLDGMMLLQENEANNVLVGAIDEITGISHDILTRMGIYRRRPVSNLNLFTPASKGTIAGEGAAFFLLANKPSGTDYARLDGLATFYKPNNTKEIEEKINSFLALHKTSSAEIDIVITGRNGDMKNDEVYDQLERSVFNKNTLVNYKHLCGEYPTSTAFAVWLAANIIKTGAVPDILQQTTTVEKKIGKVLVYNNYLGIHHSLVLLSAC
jgi:3-oxoacyl-[acyl-carrier-protein] synthase II